MKRYFNIAADCKPNRHYMVNIDRQLGEIKRKVDRGEYFVMNRARQYGKTTTLKALKRYLKDEYIVIDMDFQRQMSDAKFKNEYTFSIAFGNAFLEAFKRSREEVSHKITHILDRFQENICGNKEDVDLVELFNGLSSICMAFGKPVVLLIDEVDSATNNQVFLDFLAQLRGSYIERDDIPTFHSVILAGVYDVKNLKGKIRPEEEHKTNSPWNIAAKFNVDMSFSAPDIANMLSEYEQDYHTGMDIKEIAELIYDYTSGYPFLVSDICKIMDEEIPGDSNFPNLAATWTKKGFLEAVKILLSEKNTLFESLVNKLAEYPELKNMLYGILFQGRWYSYNPLNKDIEIAEMFGFAKNQNGMVMITNRIFETILYNLFLSTAETQNSDIYKTAMQEKYRFIENGILNMKLILERFVECFSELYGNREEKFLEEDGRRYFLLFLRPIINGTGNYYIEARTRDLRRTDVIVDYLGKQYIIELKIWHGEEYNRRGEEQLAGYLEDYRQEKGYLVSFNFNRSKEVGVKEIQCGDKVIVEAVV